MGARGRSTSAGEVYYLASPGPGNSEGPANPDGWIEQGEAEAPSKDVPEGSQAALLTTFPWPGPGNSEA